jgi:hypothetical protein
MRLRHKRVYLACLVLHFLVILGVSCRETLWLLGHEVTILPGSSLPLWQKAENIFTKSVGPGAGMSRIRQAFQTYEALGGVEAGYGFFAPNIPDNYKLVFELHYADGRVEYDLPVVGAEASGLRVASLLDKIGRTPYDVLRRLMLKMLTYATWREHPDAKMIRAVFGTARLKSITGFEEASPVSYQPLCAYDFRFRDSSEKAAPP